MAHVNRRIGKSSETANPNADGTGGGVLDAFLHDYFKDQEILVSLLEYPHKEFQQLVVLLMIMLLEAIFTEHIFLHHRHLLM